MAELSAWEALPVAGAVRPGGAPSHPDRWLADG